MNCREKLWTVSGKYFGLLDRVSVMIISRALYGLKSRGAAWSAKLAETLNYTGHISTYLEPDVWIKFSVKPSGE